MSLTLLACSFIGLSVSDGPETHRYLVLRLFHEPLKLHHNFPIIHSCNLCRPGKMFG
jgi:hypothetical protein